MQSFCGNKTSICFCSAKICCVPFRNHGRYMTKGGYVDSSRRIRSLHRQQDSFQSTPYQSPSRTGILASINKSPLSAPPAATTSTKKPKKSDVTESISSQSLSANLENKKKEHEKQMKLIEVCFSALIRGMILIY